jgi:uncharacterized membrane protein
MHTVQAPPPPAAPRDGALGLTYRQWIAVVALLNAFVATYLYLWKIGLAGSLSCGGSGGCTVVQFSPWSRFLGVDVSLIGATGYATILAVAAIGAASRLVDARGIAVALATLIYGAFVFTLRLKYYEFFVLRAFCPWCAISAVSITLLTVVVTLELRRVRLVARLEEHAH